MNSATEFVDEPDTIRDEFMNDGLLMTDSKTTKLLKEFADQFSDAYPLGDIVSEYAERIEQAIAATLGSGEPPYDELIRCLENDWHIKASWDGLRKFWCIELTEEGVKLRDATHGTLTAEQVREAIEANSWAETCTIREFNDSSWQEIADELNKLVSGTCELEPLSAIDVTLNMLDSVGWCECSNCGHATPDESNYCQHCGARIRKKVGE